MQRALVTEAEIYKEREARGIKDKPMEEKEYMDPLTKQDYENFYWLGPQQFPEGAADFNPAASTPHYGKS